MPKQIPVYLFVGQLESGKTKFIQETMEDPNFDSGDKTLLLVCEEGEIEYDPSKFAFGGVHVAQIEDKSELTAENLTALEKKSGCGRVIIEYNGMWLIQELYDALPDNWLIYQSLATADGTTIKTYAGDSAMRSLLLDKLRGSELLVVNRAEAVNDDESRQLIHKLVRQASRRCDIAYEFKDGSVAYDDIPDPLPFDVNAPVIDIHDDDFGIWYMDCQDAPILSHGRIPEGVCLFVLSHDINRNSERYPRSREKLGRLRTYRGGHASKPYAWPLQTIELSYQRRSLYATEVYLFRGL